MSTSTQQIAPDVLLMSFPWRALGIDFRRTVTLLRLSDGQVVVHSSAKFTDEDIAAIRHFGEPAWLVDATLMHDTFAKEGRARLPGIPYLAPKGFTKRSGVPTESLWPPPAAWVAEIDVLKIDGARMNEHVLYHRRSRNSGRGRSFLFVSGRNTRMATLFRAALHAVAAAVRDQLCSIVG